MLFRSNLICLILLEELNKLNLPNTVVKRTYNPYSHVSDLEIKIINSDIEGNKNGELEAFIFSLNLDALRQCMLIRYGIERKPGFGNSRNLGLIVCPYPLKAFKIKDYFNEFISKATAEIDQWTSVVYMRTDHY